MTKLWITQDGRQLDPAAMSTQHIRNALNMLRRNGFVSPKVVSFYMTCVEPNGEMAQVCFDREFQAVMEAPVSEFIDIFEEELRKRDALSVG